MGGAFLMSEVPLYARGDPPRAGERGVQGRRETALLMPLPSEEGTT